MLFRFLKLLIFFNSYFFAETIFHKMKLFSLFNCIVIRSLHKTGQKLEKGMVI